MMASSAHLPEEKELVATDLESGKRIDVFLSERTPGLSRRRWQVLIKNGFVLVNGAAVKPHHPLRTGDRVTYRVPPPEAVALQAQDLPLALLHEDNDIIVVNKPPGLVVHPSAGHASGTLVNALLYHCRDLQGVGGALRPGIVHRLDKDTSGALVVAKNEAAMQSLAKQFKGRQVRKIYLALVCGHPEPPSRRLETLLGRSRHDRKKMSATPPSGRRAVTQYETVEKLAEAALLRVQIETGRTHQIRVHLAHAGYPVLGDTQYGGARSRKFALHVPRQMLHAHQLTLTHPRTGQELEFVAPMPTDMQDVLRALRLP